MKREIIVTGDGSTTIHLPDLNESYHSKHGAIQEAVHVFIKNGLDLIEKEEVSILEIGFGTGLNAWLTYFFAQLTNKKINYKGVEAYPVALDEVLQLNYHLQWPDFDNGALVFSKMHQCAWEQKTAISNFYHLQKCQLLFDQINDKNTYDLIYFDAFGFRVQPELWSEQIFAIMFNALKSGGILTTYACRTPIKKAMESVGFKTQKLAGPPGKREMLRAIKE